MCADGERKPCAENDRAPLLRNMPVTKSDQPAAERAAKRAEETPAGPRLGHYMASRSTQMTDTLSGRCRQVKRQHQPASKRRQTGEAKISPPRPHYIPTPTDLARDPRLFSSSGWYRSIRQSPVHWSTDSWPPQQQEPFRRKLMARTEYTRLLSAGNFDRRLQVSLNGGPATCYCGRAAR